MKTIREFLEKDHQVINEMFEGATRDLNHIDHDLFFKFRLGLLTHIGIEEKVVFRRVQLMNQNTPTPLILKLRAEHAVIGALMVPTPDIGLIRVIQYALEKHNVQEEGVDGMYHICDQMMSDQLEEILQQMKSFPPALIKEHKDSPIVWSTIKINCTKIGWDYDQIAAGKV